MQQNVYSWGQKQSEKLGIPRLQYVFSVLSVLCSLGQEQPKQQNLSCSQQTRNQWKQSSECHGEALPSCSPSVF